MQRRLSMMLALFPDPSTSGKIEGSSSVRVEVDPVVEVRAGGNTYGV